MNKPNLLGIYPAMFIILMFFQIFNWLFFGLDYALNVQRFIGPITLAIFAAFLLHWRIVERLHEK